MKIGEYKKRVMATLSVAPAKVGIRQMLRKKTTLNLGHALVGISTETGEVVEVLSPFIAGSAQLKAVVPAVRSEFGDLLYYTVLAAKVQKVKLPSSTKKVKLKAGTITENLLRLNTLAKDLLSAYKRVYYGLELDQPKINALLAELVTLVWELSYTLFGEPPEQLMVENDQKLQKRFAAGQFEQQAILDKEATDAGTPVAAEPAAEAAPTAEAAAPAAEEIPAAATPAA